MTDEIQQPPPERREIETTRTSNLLLVAYVCVFVGVLSMVVFLAVGFTAWSVGLGVFFGMPVTLVGIVLYIIVVIRDLRRQGVV